MAQDTEEVDVRALFGVDAAGNPAVETPVEPAVTETITTDTLPVTIQPEAADVEDDVSLPVTPPPEPVLPAPEPEKTWEGKKIASLRALDKVTARTQSFDTPVGQTTRFGDLYIKVQSCREPPAIFTPESAAFIQIWDVPLGQSASRWVFSGWMFATSPALSAMDHPVYDVWVIDCKNPNEEKAPKVEPSAPQIQETEAVEQPAD